MQFARPAAAPAPRARTPAFDRASIDNAPRRRGYTDLVRAGEDVAHFSCHLCHERGQPPALKFDARHRSSFPKSTATS